MGAAPFPGQSVCIQQRGVAVVFDLVVLLFEVIMFAVIFLLVVIFLVVLLFATRMIMAFIVLMATVMLMFVTIALVPSMVVTILVTMMLVVQVMAASDGNMSRLLFLWLFLLLELTKEAGRFVGNLTLLQKRHKPKRVCGHCFVCFRKL
jgi:hypothetical protein